MPITAIATLRNEDALAHLPRTEIREYKKGHHIYRSIKQDNPRIYLIQEGVVAMETSDSRRGEMYLGLRAKNDLIGYELMTSEMPHTSAYCLNDVLAMSWLASDMSSLALRDVSLTAGLFMAQSLHVAELESRAKISAKKRPQQLAAILSIAASKIGVSEDEQTYRIPANVFTQTVLGKFVWTSREIVTTCMSRFRKAGWLSYNRRYITIYGINRLIRYSEGEIELPIIG